MSNLEIDSWDATLKQAEQSYIARWETGYTFTEPATGTVAWFCEREKWQHDLVIPQRSLITHMIKVAPYKLSNMIWTCKGYEKEVKVLFVKIINFSDVEVLDSDYICVNNVEVKSVHPLDACEAIEKFRDEFQDKSFLKQISMITESVKNVVKKTKTNKKKS